MGVMRGCLSVLVFYLVCAVAVVVSLWLLHIW